MKKDDFLKLGLDDEIAKKCEAASLEELKEYIPKSRFDEVNSAKKKFESDVKDRDKQLEDLKKSTGNIEDLKKQIESLQKENKEKAEHYELEMQKLRVDTKIDSTLSNFGARNIRSVKALLDGVDKFKFDKDGNIEGLEDQIKQIKKSDPYLFANNDTSSVKGVKPVESTAESKSVDVNNMTYSELVSYMSNNPDFKLNN
ncbi:Minor structural GP20 protein [Candidatus Arthromitus sp. SFB-co]|nr:Minor structural GP20 protein [Candidatus Arthromitus sp. SFB-co]